MYKGEMYNVQVHNVQIFKFSNVQCCKCRNVKLYKCNNCRVVCIQTYNMQFNFKPICLKDHGSRINGYFMASITKCKKL